MSTVERYLNGTLRERWDDAARIYTTWNAGGTQTASRPFTAAENAAADPRAAAEARQAVAATLASDTTADLANITAAIGALATLLGDATVAGSVRQVMGATTDPAGLTSLRAWKSQTAANVVTATSLKALADLILTLCQRVIDDAQADRKIARQTLRLAKAMVGDYSSADVGAP